jgi:hypothetical protein
LKATLYVTDARVVLACPKFDKGGGWVGLGVGGLAVAAVANVASKARAAKRRKGRLLIGHVRYPWLGRVVFTASSDGLLSTESVMFTVTVREDGVDRVLALEARLNRGAGAPGVAHSVATRSARYHLAHDTDLNDDQEAAFVAVRDATPIAPDKNHSTFYSMPTYRRVMHRTAYPSPAQHASGWSPEPHQPHEASQFAPELPEEHTVPAELFDQTVRRSELGDPVAGPATASDLARAPEPVGWDNRGDRPTLDERGHEPPVMGSDPTVLRSRVEQIPPPPAAGGQAARVPGSTWTGRRTAAVAGSVLFAVIGVVAIVVLSLGALWNGGEAEESPVARSTRASDADTSVPSSSPTIAPGPSVPIQDAAVPSTIESLVGASSAGEATNASGVVATAGPPGIIEPATAWATSVLPEQQPACTGEVVSYTAIQALDGNGDTAWAPEADDGIGEVLTVDLGGEVRLASVGLIPGYAKRGPLSWAGCAVQEQFWLNRWVRSVRWTFDDGSSVVQVFDHQPEMQAMAVDVLTGSVRMEILDSELPPGERVDDDTLISDVSFTGWSA